MADPISRFRSRGGFATPPNKQSFRKWGVCSETDWTLQSTDSCLVKPGVYDTMSDTVIPGFYNRVRKGETFFNPLTKNVRTNQITSNGNGVQYEATANTITCSGVDHKVAYREDGPQFARFLMLHAGSPSDGLLPLYFPISDADIRSLSAEVSTKLLAKRGTAGSNLYESVAEVHQTLGLLRRPFSSLHKLLNKASGVRGRVIGAAESWLTYRYGIMPIVRDVNSVISGLKKKVGKQRITSRVSGSLSRSSNVTTSFTSGAFVTLTYGKQTTMSCDVRGMSLDEYIVSLGENIGFTDKGLVTLPWDLIPYSFVVDWFANVGDFLNALVPLPGVNQLGSALVVKTVTQTVYSPLGTQAPANHILQRSISGSCLAKNESTVRTSILQPELTIRSDFRLLDAERAADAVSLLIQRMDRLFK